MLFVLIIFPTSKLTSNCHKVPRRFNTLTFLTQLE